MVAQVEFSFLSKAERGHFVGVENEDARIGYYGEDLVIIVDGSTVQFMYSDGEFETFNLK